MTEVLKPKGKTKKVEKSDSLKLTDYKLKARKKELTKLAGDYKNLVVTKKTLPEAKKARAKVREARYEIQDIEKENNKKLNAFKLLNKSEAGECYLIIRPVEDKIHGDIKLVEDETERLKAEKDAAEQAEIDRLAALDQKVEEFDRQGMNKVLEAKTIDELDTLKKKIDEYDVSPEGSFKEKSPDAFMIKTKLLNEIESRRSDVKELEEARKAQAELEELRAEKAKREKEAKERREAEIIDMQNRLIDLGLTCAGENFVYGDVSISVDDIDKMTLLEFNKKVREDIQPKIEAIKIKEKEEEEESKRSETLRGEREEKLKSLGLIFDGEQYAYKDINFHWQELLTMEVNEFDKQFDGAKKRMEVIRAEETAEAEKIEAQRVADNKKFEAENEKKRKKAETARGNEWIYKIVNLSKIPTAFIILNEEAVEVAIASGVRKIPGLKIGQRKNVTD